MAKDGVVSIAIDYKNELNQMIRDYESALTEMASNDKLSKGMKSQFDSTIAELKRFKADMEKSFSDLSIGKVDKNSFKAFKQTVNKNFESVRAEIDRLDLAVSTINSQIKILGNGVDISKISSQFKDFQDYVQNTNNAIDIMIKKLDGQGISLMSFDDSAVNQAKSQIKEINKLLKSTDEFSDAKGSKYELFDTDQAQAELDVLARDLKNTLELIEKSESELSNFDKNSIGFEKTINQINILKLKAADLHDSIQQLIDIPDKTGEYTFGDSILISDDNVDKKVSEYGKIVKGTLDEIRESAIKTREELEKVATPTSSKTASAKISDKLNPNSAELVTGVTIETTSSELWKKLSPILEDLQNDLNENPVVAPVKLVVAPNAVSSEKNGEVGTISKSYSKKYQRELAKTGEDAVIDLEGVYKKTFTSIMDEAVSYSKETISKIQNIFESSSIKLHFDFNEEEFKKISDALLSSDSGKKIDITGQIAESKKEVNELAEKLAEVNELLNSADSKDFSFKGFDKFAEEISKSLGQLTELQSMLKTLQNIESTLARASGVSSVTDIETQWKNISKLIDNSIKLDGTFRKNANVDKLASEYNKYLNMGGTNELSSIGKVGKLENSKNIIDAILSKVKELNSQKVDTSSVDKVDGELKSVSFTLDDVISRLDHMINLTRDIGNTFYKIFKDASVSDVDKQWSSIESKFKSIADESGKINLSKQKKDIQELIEMYQKYANAGSMNTLFDLTDNAETIKKMNKVYEQMNSKKDGASVTNESKNFTKVEDSVNSLTSAINTKTEAIKTEANTMELAARAEVKSIQKIIDALNPLIERIESIPELKISKEDTTLPSKESNISSGSNPAIEQQNKLQEELKETQTEIVETRSKYQSLLDVAKKQLDDDKGTNYYSGKTTEAKAFDNFTFNEQAKRSSHFDVWSKDYEELCSLMDKTEEELKSDSIGFDDAIDRMVSAYQKYDTATKIDVGGFDFLDGVENVPSVLSDTEKAVLNENKAIKESEYTLQDYINTYLELKKVKESSLSVDPKITGVTSNGRPIIKDGSDESFKAELMMKDMESKVLQIYGKDLSALADEHIKASESAKEHAKAENQVTQAIKESSSTASQDQRKDAFPNAEEIKQKEKLAEATRKLCQEEKQSSQDSVNSALKDQVFAWKQIQSIREKIAKADNPDVINQLQETKKYYQQQYLDATKILKSNQNLYDAQGQLNRLKQIELEITAKINQYQSKNAESVLKYNQSLKDNATQKLSTYNNTSKYTPEFIERVNSKISEIGQLDITKPEDVARLKTIDNEVQKIVDDSKLLENKLVKQDSKIADIISQMKIFRSQNTNMSSSQKQALDDVINYAEKLANTGKVTAQQIEKIKISFSELKAVVASSGNMGKNFFSQIGSRLTDMNSKFVAQFLSWQDWIRYIQQGVNTIRELDTAMTEVRKVSNATESQYTSFRDTISSTAKEIATTNKELLNSSADFLRLGYSLDQASDLAKNATLFVNVGDGVDITEATEDMITAMKAFDIQAKDSIKIVDDYNQIGNQFALSASDIGEAMKRSASALETGNNSFEQSIGLITAMNEIVQNSENTGNSLKVLSLRLRGAKAELEDMQEDTDGLCDSTSKLREQIKSLTGVDIMLDDNTFKSTTDIIKELGAVWDKLSDSSQAATLELIAGKSRANNVAALLKNYQKIDEVMESLGDAEGSAMRENEAIVDSINGRIKVLSATAEEFWQNFIDTDFVKELVSLTSDLLNILTKIVNIGNGAGILGLIGAGTGIFKFIKNFDWVLKPYIKTLSNSF